ncbi:hypothetical protein [Cohnella sp. AR92]|uniref:hypothetical protein n=1 Tax=Cohnella sp. AR92 TaxID=648716 RepID=UPI000F8EA5D6|nr:hypothetical protein [Cohnella sp. AR92]RUS48829.1 hypothetical protein ELR57_00310 [Cohnella sp. AR92]
MLIIVYSILVVIVILLLVVFNVRASKKRNAAPEADSEVAGEDKPEPAIEGTARTEETAAVAKAEPGREAAGESAAANRVEATSPAGSEPGPSRADTGDTLKEALKDDSRDYSGDVAREIPRDVAKDGSRDISRDGRRGASRDDSRDVSKDRAAPARRDPSGKDVSFRGALREMSTSTGSGNRAELPPRPSRSGDSAITDNDYRKALRKMRAEDKKDRS